MLICPNCRRPLQKDEKTYHCDAGHSFDIARNGYTNLLVHTQKKTGDNEMMVKARDEFFKKDPYRCLKETIVALVCKYQPQVIVDAGCGEGYYTNAVAEAVNGRVYGFDMSKHALKKASRDSKRVAYFAANLFYLPLEDQSVDLLYSVFAPLAMAENARVLKNGGIFIKAGPGPRHLYGIKEIVYDTPYLNPLKAVEHPDFILVDELMVKDVIELSGDDIRNLFEMTPYTHSSPRAGKERLYALDHLKTEIEFRIEILQRTDRQ